MSRLFLLSVRGHEFGAVGNTPSIKFSEGQQMIFNASGDAGITTPQRRPQSPGSVRKCKRYVLVQRNRKRFVGDYLC